MEPMPQGGDGVDIVIVPVVPVASIFPLGVPRLGVGVGAPRVGALAMVVLFRAKNGVCQDVSAAAEKRARWNGRWHTTMAAPVDDCFFTFLRERCRLFFLSFGFGA